MCISLCKGFPFLSILTKYGSATSVNVWGTVQVNVSNSKPGCMICANEHKTRTCPHKGETGELFDNRECANCGGNHTANYGGCKVYREAKHVERVRADKRCRLSQRSACNHHIFLESGNRRLG